jgi:hypothetical protein
MPRLLWPSWRWMTISGTPFARQLDGVRVPELVRREASAHSSREGGPAHIRSGGFAGPVATTRRTVDDAKQRTDRKLNPQLKPRMEFIPAPVIHADLAPASALAASDEQGPAALIEIGLGEAEGFLDP